LANQSEYADQSHMPSFAGKPCTERTPIGALQTNPIATDMPMVGYPPGASGPKILQEPFEGNAPEVHTHFHMSTGPYAKPRLLRLAGTNTAAKQALHNIRHTQMPPIPWKPCATKGRATLRRNLRWQCCAALEVVGSWLVGKQTTRICAVDMVFATCEHTSHKSVRMSVCACVRVLVCVCASYLRLIKPWNGRL
jgi:hypothetical protein